jgi:hypothetical protein
MSERVRVTGEVSHFLLMAAVACQLMMMMVCQVKDGSPLAGCCVPLANLGSLAE